MEISEAAKRIFRARGLVILAFLLTGLAAGFGVHKVVETKTYTASARLVLSGSVPQNSDWAAALAGTVQGIVTSPAELSKALAEAGATRDIVKFTKDVDTQSLSSSSVLQLSVTDPNAGVATAVANTLATDAVATLNAQAQQPSQALLGELQAQIDPLESEIAAIGSELSVARSSDVVTALLAQRSDLSQQMTALITKQADIQQQMVQSQGASVVAPATRPDVADPSRLPLDLILGAIAGLILGIGLAVILETMRPTLVGRLAIERALGAPVFGVINASAPGDLSALIGRLHRAAERARASTVVLWSRDADLSDVVRRLQGTKPSVVRAARPSLTVRAAVPGEPVNPRWALVVVVPPTVPLRTIEQADELRTDEGLTVLGAIIMPRRRRTPWSRQRSAVATPESTQVEESEEQPSAVLVS
ncbi:MAG: hypothetical protein WB805_12415 [Candidatus Dormiibacterota bacterium]